MSSNRYRIECRVCEEWVYLKEVDAGEYECLTCHTIYTGEDGVQDMNEAEYYAQLHAGEVRAGLYTKETLRDRDFNA